MSWRNRLYNYTYNSPLLIPLLSGFCLRKRPTMSILTLLNSAYKEGNRLLSERVLAFQAPTFRARRRLTPGLSRRSRV